MKKLLVLACFISVVTISFAQPKISGVSFPKQVDVYGLCEISFLMGSYENPYDPQVIDVYAEFISPSGTTYRVNGFYYEAYSLMESKGIEVAARNGDNDGWKIRFTPNEVGRWVFTLHAVDETGSVRLTSCDGVEFAFGCQAKDAEGFVRKANSCYLKREAFVGKEHQYHSFFPVGPNVAWYRSADYGKFKKPYGIYEYARYIDSLAGNANYMRIWLNRYQYMSLYGPEHAIRENGLPVMYFDSDINQKDAAELDFIVSYAADHGITLMPCLFSFGDFRDDSEGLDSSEKNASMPSGWRYNPYHTILKLERPVEFFTDPEAIRISGNLIRYIVARWGYATNIEAWELWNEVCNIYKNIELQCDEEEAILQWHRDMAALIRSVDPHQHLVTTSLGSVKEMPMLWENVFDDLDVVQMHYYDNIQKATSRHQMPQRLFEKSEAMRELYPMKPNFIGEYGLNNAVSGIDYLSRDPKGIDIHNSLWASFFSGYMGPASFWYWRYLDKGGLFGRFKPVTVFSNNLPMLSDDFVSLTTGDIDGSSMVFPNNFQTYYLINREEDTILGWCQDMAFAYQSLRHQTDVVGGNGHFDNDGVRDPQGYVYTLDASKKPQAAAQGDIIRIPMEKQPRGTRYQVKWYDAETGLELSSEATVETVRYRLFRGRHLRLHFPDSLRDGYSYTNSFGDAVFVIYKIND